MTGMRSLFVLAMLSAQGAIAAENEPPQVTQALRQRAEDLAGAASQRFSDILDGGQRVEIAQGARSQAASSDQAAATGTFAPVWNWLYRAQKSYDDVVIAQLKNPNGWTVIVQRSGEPASPPASESAAEMESAPQLKGWSGLVEMVRDWLARANRSYRNEIVTPLREPGAAGVPSELAKQPSSAAEPGDEIKREAEEEAQARSRSLAAKRAAEEDDAKRRAEATGQAKQQGDAAAAKRAAAEAEAKRRDREQAIAARRAEDEERSAAAAEAERKAVAEFRARQIEAAAAARRKADDDARAAREAKAKRVAEEETKRREAEAKRQAAEADAAERKAVAEAEAESKRKAEIEAEATRRSQEAAKAKEAERTKRAEQAKEPARADVTAVQPAPSAAAPAPAAKPAAPASAPPATPPPPPVAKENSTVAAGTAAAAKEEKPPAPAPEREATPKAREESVVAEAAPPTTKKKSLKRSATKWRSGKKQAYAYRHKKHRAYKPRQPRRAYAQVGKRRWASSEAVYVERRCACRCGGIFSRPRKHKRVIWGGYAPSRVHGYKHRHGRLTHRHRRHYID
jgi:hypothetical protein